MAAVKDPVCGMTIDSVTAAGRTVYEGWNTSSARRNASDSSIRIRRSITTAITKTGPIVAPKFGAAGSGGAEYEPLPDERP